MRRISWAGGCVMPAKVVVAFIKNHYTKSYAINQHELQLFSLFCFSFVSVSISSDAKSEAILMREKSVYRFTINHKDFASPPPFCKAKLEQIYGAFRFISLPPCIVLFSSLSRDISHTKQLLINHLFKLVFCTTSINYPRSGFYLLSCVWLIKESCSTFVCKLFLSMGEFIHRWSELKATFHVQPLLIADYDRFQMICVLILKGKTFSLRELPDFPWKSFGTFDSQCASISMAWGNPARMSCMKRKLKVKHHSNWNLKFFVYTAQERAIMGLNLNIYIIEKISRLTTFGSETRWSASLCCLQLRFIEMLISSIILHYY